MQKDLAMNKKDLLDSTIKKMEQLSEDKIREVNDFVEFLLQRREEYVINEGVKQMTSESKSFEFLQEEDDIYTVNDLKEKYK